MKTCHRKSKTCHQNSTTHFLIDILKPQKENWDRVDWDGKACQGNRKCCHSKLGRSNQKCYHPIASQLRSRFLIIFQSLQSCKNKKLQKKFLIPALGGPWKFLNHGHNGIRTKTQIFVLFTLGNNIILKSSSLCQCDTFPQDDPFKVKGQVNSQIFYFQRFLKNF